MFRGTADDPATALVWLIPGESWNRVRGLLRLPHPAWVADFSARNFRLKKTAQRDKRNRIGRE
jgi:hypothetical protein